MVGRTCFLDVGPLGVLDRLLVVGSVLLDGGCSSDGYFGGGEFPPDWGEVGRFPMQGGEV